MAENKNALPIGTILNARYEIEGLIGGGGFGLVYRARHTGLNAAVAIKELFPRDIVVRQGKTVHPVSEADTAIYQKVLSSFRKEGKRLASLGSCPSIVQCSDYFEENGSGYLVMEYIEGRSLREVVRSYRKNNQTFSEASLITLLNELLKGLKEVHKAGIQHMDIKPENIYVRETEGADELSNPVLLDFGASRSQSGHSTGSNLLVGTVPYAPIEQMHERGDMGPWTDIYALGITLYELMFRTDEIPGCTERISDIHSKEIDPLQSAKSRGTRQYSERFLRLIDQCVAIKAKERPQNVEEVENLLTKEPISTPKTSKMSKTVKHSSTARAPSRKIAIFVSLLIILAMTGGYVHVYKPDIYSLFTGWPVDVTIYEEIAYAKKNIKFYANNNNSSEIIGSFNENEVVNIIGKPKKEGWFYVQSNGQQKGYIQANDVEIPNQILFQRKQHEFIAKSEIPKHNLPDYRFNSDSKFSRGEPVKLIGITKDPDWPEPMAVINDNGVHAFLPRAKLRFVLGMGDNVPSSAMITMVGTNSTVIAMDKEVDYELGSRGSFQIEFSSNHKEYLPVKINNLLVDGMNMNIELQPCYNEPIFEEKEEAITKYKTVSEKKRIYGRGDGDSESRAKRKAKEEIRDECDSLPNNDRISSSDIYYDCDVEYGKCGDYCDWGGTPNCYYNFGYSLGCWKEEWECDARAYCDYQSREPYTEMITTEEMTGSEEVCPNSPQGYKIEYSIH